jgi:hypothetical protein
MFGSAIFEAAIGTLIVYILLSLMCLVFNEWVTRLLNLRSRVLEGEIRQLLGLTLAQELSNHPLIRGAYNGRHYPNYIPASTFAMALMELAYDYTPGTKGEPGTTNVKRKWTYDDFVLLDSLRLAATSMGPIQTRIEKWFDLAMEQASGRFKRIANSIVLLFSAIIIGIAGVDTISINAHLYDGALLKQPTHFVLFYGPGYTEYWYVRMAGLILTWACVSLGAPFWFDVLNKLVNLRQTGLPPDENKRQTGVPHA